MDARMCFWMTVFGESEPCRERERGKNCKILIFLQFLKTSNLWLILSLYLSTQKLTLFGELKFR